MLVIQLRPEILVQGEKCLNAVENVAFFGMAKFWIHALRIFVSKILCLKF